MDQKKKRRRRRRRAKFDTAEIQFLRGVAGYIRRDKVRNTKSRKS
jgi:hypothetical protein